jgi:putative transposase
MAKKRKRSVITSWRMDETYVKVKSQWVYLYRAVNKLSDTILKLNYVIFL